MRKDIRLVLSVLAFQLLAFRCFIAMSIFHIQLNRAQWHLGKFSIAGSNICELSTVSVLFFNSRVIPIHRACSGADIITATGEEFHFVFDASFLDLVAVCLALVLSWKSPWSHRHREVRETDRRCGTLYSIEMMLFTRVLANLCLRALKTAIARPTSIIKHVCQSKALETICV